MIQWIKTLFNKSDKSFNIDKSNLYDYNNALADYRYYIDTIKIDKNGNKSVNEYIIDTIKQTESDLDSLSELSTIELYNLVKLYENTHIPNAIKISKTAYNVLFKTKIIINISFHIRLNNVSDKKIIYLNNGIY